MSKGKSVPSTTCPGPTRSIRWRSVTGSWTTEVEPQLVQVLARRPGSGAAVLPDHGGRGRRGRVVAGSPRRGRRRCVGRGGGRARPRRSGGTGPAWSWWGCPPRCTGGPVQPFVQAAAHGWRNSTAPTASARPHRCQAVVGEIRALDVGGDHRPRGPRSRTAAVGCSAARSRCCRAIMPRPTGGPAPPSAWSATPSFRARHRPRPLVPDQAQS